MNVERTLLDLDKLEELADGELALVRFEGVTDDSHAIGFRVLQDVVDDVWTVVSDDFLTPANLLQVMAHLPRHVVLYDLHTDELGVTTLTWLERKDALVLGP